MTSKKKSNSAFRKTFLIGATFLFIFFVFAVVLVGGIITSYLHKNPQIKKFDEKKTENPADVQRVKVDTVYITKTVVEKCTKMHCDVEISHVDSPIVETKQHDSTNN